MHTLEMEGIMRKSAEKEGAKKKNRLPVRGTPYQKGMPINESNSTGEKLLNNPILF
jgi:hypothetical protein